MRWIDSSGGKKPKNNPFISKTLVLGLGLRYRHRPLNAKREIIEVIGYHLITVQHLGIHIRCGYVSGYSILLLIYKPYVISKLLHFLNLYSQLAIPGILHAPSQQD